MSQDQASNHDEIAALIDGEVTGAAAAVLAQRLAAEPQLAARARRIRALDDLVRQAVPVADAVPADLVARLGLADVTAATAPSAEVVDLAAARAAVPPRAAPAPGRAGHWPMLRVAAQAAFVTGVGVVFALWQSPAAGPDSGAGYRTLSSGVVSAPANGVVVFAPGVDRAAASAIAAGAGGQLLGGPNAAGAWKLTLPAGRRNAALAALRADRRVVLAQPLDGPQP